MIKDQEGLKGKLFSPPKVSERACQRWVAINHCVPVSASLAEVRRESCNMIFGKFGERARTWIPSLGVRMGAGEVQPCCGLGTILSPSPLIGGRLEA